MYAIRSYYESGASPLWMSRISSGIPIYALTRHVETRRKVTLYRGVYPVSFDVTTSAKGTGFVITSYSIHYTKLYESLLEKISAKISEQRKEIGSLKRDEKQLSQLVARLSKIIAARKIAPAPSRNQIARGGKDAPGTRRRNDSEITNEKTPEAMQQGEFPKLRA